MALGVLGSRAREETHFLEFRLEVAWGRAFADVELGSLAARLPGRPH